MQQIDLVLSGCGVRLGAHIGAIKALEELDYEIVRICGTSGGSIAGGMYATGMAIDDLVKEIKKIDFKKLRKFSLLGLVSNYGLYSTDKIRDYINRITGGILMKNLQRDFYACVTEESKGLIVLNKQNAADHTLGEVVAASSAVPFYFQRIQWENAGFLLDGGLLKNYPIDVLDEQREVLGLHIHRSRPKTYVGSSNMIDFIKHLVTTVVESIEREHVEDAHWAKTIPIIVDGFSPLDFDMTKSQKSRLVDIGYESVIKWHERKR